MMSSDNPPSAVPPKPRRWIKHMAGGFVLLAVLMAVLTLSVVTNRPQWRTLTSTGKPGEWGATVQCPDTWTLDTSVSTGAGMPAPFTGLILRPTPPTGFLAWWSKYVLRRALTLDQETGLSVFITKEGLPGLGSGGTTPNAKDRDKDLDLISNGMQGLAHSPNVSHFQIRHFRHALGPSVLIEYDQSVPSFVKGSNAAVPSSTTLLYILPEATPGFKGSVMVVTGAPLSEYPRLESTLKRMANSVRLVKK